MTERALPLRSPSERTARPNLRVVPDARAAVRPAATTRRPIHVAVAVGVTASVYALSLAGVTGLQAGTDARLAAERAPAAAAVGTLKSTHDRLEADLGRLSAGYASAAGTYQGLADRIGAHEAALTNLDGRVAAVEGSAASLRVPTIARLPTVSTRTVYASAKPVSNACTTASGKPC
jgi:hypothetical protein